MRRSYQIIINTFIITLVLSIVQFSWISSWPSIFNKINILVITLVFVLFFFGQFSALLFSLFAGLLMEFYSFDVFALYLLSFFVTTFVAYKILKNWLTNRSLYSFLSLMLIVNVVYSFVLYFLLYVEYFGKRPLFILEKSFWLGLSWQVIWSVISALLLFHLVMAISKKLKPFFLENK